MKNLIFILSLVVVVNAHYSFNFFPYDTNIVDEDQIFWCKSDGMVDSTIKWEIQNIRLKEDSIYLKIDDIESGVYEVWVKSKDLSIYFYIKIEKPNTIKQPINYKPKQKKIINNYNLLGQRIKIQNCSGLMINSKKVK